MAGIGVAEGRASTGAGTGASAIAAMSAGAANTALGCAHKCRYCYARAYHARYHERDVGVGFDSQVDVKINIVDRLRAELRRRPEGALAIGTATDPYQPIQGKYRLTRGCLEALVDYPMPTSIVTKGTLVVRDVDVLQQLDDKADVTVY